MCILLEGFTNVPHISKLELIPLLLILVDSPGDAVLKFTPLLIDLLGNCIALSHKFVVLFAKDVNLADHVPMLRIHRRKVLP